MARAPASLHKHSGQIIYFQLILSIFLLIYIFGNNLCCWFISNAKFWEENDSRMYIFIYFIKKDLDELHYLEKKQMKPYVRSNLGQI